MSQPPTIVVDVHEERSGIADLLEELGAIVERAPLSAGDYLVGADTIVERKRVLDLHSAITKGHLWGQIGKLRNACAFPYLLVEGTNLDRGPVHANAIRGVCLAVIDLGIALLRSDHQRDSARWLHRLAVRCQRAEPPAERPLYAQRPKPTVGDPTAEALLSAVPGISVSTARALLEHFGTVASVLRARSRASPGGSPDSLERIATVKEGARGGTLGSPTIMRPSPKGPTRAT